MPEETTAQKEGSESPPHGPEGNPPPGNGGTRSRRKKILVPVVLAVIGLTAILVAWLYVYPRRADATPAASGQLQITGNSSWVNSHLVGIWYTVEQVHPDVARITVTVGVPGARIPRGAHVVIQLSQPHVYQPHVSQPHGLTVLQCFPRCYRGGDSAAAVAYFGHPAPASAYFVVKAPGFEVAANGATAAVSFPEVIFTGTHQVTMNLAYEGGIPAANSYDWSSYPATLVSKSDVEWVEPVAPGPATMTNGRVVSGVSHAAQTHDSNFILAAGVLFGIGGSALVAAAQEALHD